jgi:plastocyanin
MAETWHVIDGLPKATAVRVAVGGGNSTAVLTLFVPEQVEIEAGQTISWYNPTTVAEPHVHFPGLPLNLIWS